MTERAQSPKSQIASPTGGPTKGPSKSPTKSKCPICRKPAADAFRPFCSKRCADVDLNRWFSGGYVVPGQEEEDEDGAARPGPGKDEPGA